MAPRLSPNAAAAIDRILLSGIDVDFHVLAHQHKTTYKTICERYSKLRATEAISKELRKPPGPDPIINNEMRVFMAELTEREPDLYLDEIADYLYAEYEVQVSVSQVSRAFQRMKTTNKVVTVAAMERNPDLIAAYRRKMVFWDARKICFVDESACNERTTFRRRGWAPRGMPANVRRLLKKSERWSVLPAYCLDGYIEPIIWKGSITAEIFE